MATFFSLYASSLSLALLLQLLLLTTGDLFLRANAGPLADICSQTKEPPRCVSVLRSFDPRSPTAPLPELEQIAIDTAAYTAGQNKIKVHNLMLSAKDPNIKNIYRDCENLYLDALDALLIAPEYLQQRKYGKLVEAAGIVGRAVGGCAAAFKNDARLRKDNEDVGIVAQAIAVIARNLH